MSNEFNNDNAITSSKEDKFTRANFAKKITTLCAAHIPKSRVIGIYGKWGEGKTSLLNMVSESLDPKMLQIHFNPWYFTDEEQLLRAFFKLLAEKLRKDLTTNGEKINNIIGQYGESIGILETVPKLGIVATVAKFIIKLFKGNKKPSVETARDRVNDFIIDSGLSIVVFMDDIDRLDAKEVSAIFRLVKLLADFPRTTYILSFDPEIVARMLAPSYGGVIPDSGYQFLEKVIQVPLPIPKAHDDAIISMVEKTIKDIAGELMPYITSEREMVELFADGVLALLNNPRKIIRFANAFRFSYPMVKGEVNVMDLFMIEIFKASVPGYYNYIRSNKYLFIDDYLDEKQQHYTDTRRGALGLMNEALKPYSQNVQEAIRKFTNRLFPSFVWNDPAETRREKQETLIIQKRICTEEYFDRYFTLVVQPEEISDAHFNRYYLEPGELSYKDMAEQFTADFEKYSLQKVAYKLIMFRDEIKGDDARKLILALCMVSNKFGEKHSATLGNSFAIFSLMVDTLIRALPANKKFDLAKEIIASPTSMDFAAELTARFVMPESKDRQATLFTGDHALAIKSVYIGRLKILMEEKGFFNTVAEEAMCRQLIWWNNVDRTGLQQAVDTILNNDPAAPLKLLRIFTPVTRAESNSFSGIIRTDFTEDEYLRIEETIGVSRVHELLTRQYGDLSDHPGVTAMRDKEALDDLTLVGKFQRLYRWEQDAIAIASENKPLD